MHVEFFFEQAINERIDVEWGARRTTYAEPVIDVKTAGAFQKQLNAGAANFEGVVRCWIE
jgi:hypothetical protein